MHSHVSQNHHTVQRPTATQDNVAKSMRTQLCKSNTPPDRDEGSARGTEFHETTSARRRRVFCWTQLTRPHPACKTFEQLCMSSQRRLGQATWTCRFVCPLRSSPVPLSRQRPSTEDPLSTQTRRRHYGKIAPH